ncbi:helicase-associated domain-containing protein [Microbacterium sp. ZXX196]|uniref:helicase-associated domain-containing protein n=1 Tax=Microbacterium sp. ZXX196 TaxID=2609291 RepID=UPI0034D3128F
MNAEDGAAARLIAERLRAADDRELEALFAERHVLAASGAWRDFFDAAEWLLLPEHVANALSVLPRDAVWRLASGEPLTTLALTDEAGLALPAVARALGGTSPTPTPGQEPPAATGAAAEHAAERAFTTITALADILLRALGAPLARVGTGALSATERRRLVDEQIVAAPGEADALVRLAGATGLLRGHDRVFGVTAAGAAWIEHSTPERWAVLAARLRDALPDGLRRGEGWIDPALWPDAYPLDDAWPDKARGWLEFARLVGVVADGDPPTEPAWAAPLRRGGAPDTAALAEFLPHEVDRVYLQNDLTAISPGPLAPALDVRLRRMARRESHAQASSYRFSEPSLTEALGTGETAASMRAFLEEISLTGVPQPLAYLLDRIADRHGLVRVSSDPERGHTVVTSTDPHLLRTLGVDQSLQSLGLVHEGERLRTAAAADTVFWALADARYPAVRVDAAGDPLPRDRRRVLPDPARPADAAALIERLREGHAADGDAAWLERELEAAVKDRATLAVEVNMPDGSVREMRLDATGLGGGRLRGRDAGADVERTLPVSLIRSARRV